MLIREDEFYTIGSLYAFTYATNYTAEAAGDNRE